MKFYWKCTKHSYILLLTKHKAQQIFFEQVQLVNKIVFDINNKIPIFEPP